MEPDTESPSDEGGVAPRLSDKQIALLSRFGERRRTEAGEVLFREGDIVTDLYVVLDGTVAVVDGHGTAQEQVIHLHGPREFLG
ncbi:MAG: thioredoxin reductase, partial [Actinomycetota bacterium]|nr:thioredoxin reductase [Actinomycetota bacterium]